MDINFPKIEEKILKFWKENNIFEKSVEQRAKARDFVFYEGPPTANGRPGLHHFLARIFKDIIPRYKTMRGFRVARKAGWDTHGLPVELEIEKKLILKNKKEIEKYGVAKFNKKCRESVWEYKKEWEEFTERIGFWLDMKNPYITYEPEYTETLWKIIKTAWEKRLLDQDFKVVPYCPRCGTPLSSHEVAQGYKKIKEPAIYFKLRIINPEFKNTSLLVWTTTPWTLPGNVAVAVNPQVAYAKVKIGEDYLILAKERLGILFEKPEMTEEIKGEALIGLQYQPSFDFYVQDYKKERIWEVIGADFVSLKDGTGLVHIAPAFGQEDMEAIKEQNEKRKAQNEPKFPVLMTVNEEGKFNLDVKKWAGMFVKDADPLIIEDLRARGVLFKEELYEHDYPFCWRCRTPLLYYAKKSWFIKMSELKKDLLKNNQKINWVPSHLKEGRFGEWLKEVKDWAISRERYWGTPLPVWQCQTCQRFEVVGSIKDLISKRFSTNNYFLLRHGESLKNIKKVGSCWPEKTPFPLTKKGESEIQGAAKKLKKERIDLVFSSDLLRAKQTAEIAAKETGAKLAFDKRLREFNVGVFNGKDPKFSWEYLKKTKNPMENKLPRGEGLIDVRKRMYEFLKQIDKNYQKKNILIISHELPLTILEKTLEGSPLEAILETRRTEKAGTIKTGESRRIEFRDFPFNEKLELDFHRPYIDEPKFFCPKCQGLMQRVPDVLDCWFDSGAMPFAQAHWPFDAAQGNPFKQNLKPKTLNLKPPALFPADYISEGIDQTRGWFYTLLAVSTLLGFGPSYKNVISVGHVLDEKGEKMSKSKGNVVDPWHIIKKYGVDSARWYFYTVNQAGEPKLFAEKDIDQALKKFILTLWNCFIFYKTYKTNSKVKSQKSKVQVKSKNILDRWIISKLNGLVAEVTDKLDKYDVTAAARAIESFAINDLSLWYIRRSRKRFQSPKDEKELEDASLTLAFVLETISKLTAPFVPFLSEEIYRKLGVKVSVHLEEWPNVDKKMINKKLEEEMERAREIVALAFAERAKAGIKVRQPLAKLKVKSLKSKIGGELLDLIKEEINVKEVVFDGKIKKDVELDTKINEALKEEGMIREIVRNIQEMRKAAGLKPQDKISVRYSGAENLEKLLEKNKNSMLKEARIKDLAVRERKEKKFDFEKETKVEEDNLWIGVRTMPRPPRQSTGQARQNLDSRL